MTPKFKNGDYNGGITDGARAVMDVLEGGKLPDTAGNEGGASEKSNVLHIEGPDLPIMERILIGSLYFRHYRTLHHYRYSHAGRRLVSLLISDTILGDVPDHRSRHQGRFHLRYHVPDRFPGGKTVP